MPSETPLDQLILQHVRRSEYRPSKPRQIAYQLGLRDDQLVPLKRTIKHLIRKGTLAWGPRHLVLPRAPQAPTAAPRRPGKRAAERPVRRSAQPTDVVGRFRRTSRGFGFVTPHPTELEHTQDDVFIAARATSDAADGDIVRVEVRTRRVGPDIRTSGRIVEVIERRARQFVGTYLERGRLGLVRVDGEAFDHEIAVGDAGAKNCRVGDKVVIELVRYPTPVRDGEGVIVDVLGERGRPGIDTLSVIRQFNLPDQFPEEVLTDARREVDRFTETIEPPRRDLTSHTIVTIDPWDARDFDDAISLERTSNGHWLLGVHIADVSHFVRSQTAIDTEAYRRGNSVYLPDRVLPMLPELISNNLASLQPERVRFTMTALIELDADGVVISTEFFRSAIRSAWRFNYEEIDQYLADDAPWRARLPADVFRLVRDMHNLAMVMRRRRMRRGAFDLILPEIKIDLDDDGRVKGAHLVENTESHQVIEEFMLAANEAVAQRFVDHDQVFLRRIHLPPSEVKLRDLKMFLTDLGIPCQDLSSRFEINRVLAASRDLPERDAVHFAILRSMQKAIYSPRGEGHYALASSAYLHFTSPIRRYPDLVIHRMLGAMIDGQRPKTDVGQLLAIGLHTSDTERRAEEAERDLIKLKLLNFLHDKIGSQWDAVVTGVESFGLFAQGIELPAEGFIPIESLPPDNYYYDRGTRTLAGHRSGNSYRLGDPIRVRISHVDPDRRELDFELIGRRRPGETTSHAGETTAAESRPPHRQRRRAATSSRGAPRESASSRRSRSRPAKAARTKPPERQRKSKKAAPQPATDKRRGSAKKKPKERGGRGSRQRD